VAMLEGVAGAVEVKVASGVTTLNLDGRATTTDAATLTVNGNLTVINSNQAIETLTIKNASTTAATVTFDGAGDLTVGASQVINMAGAGDLTVRVDAADVSGKTVNASMDSGKKAVLSLDTTSDDTDVSKVATAVTINLLDDDIEDELLQVANNATVRLSDDFANSTGDATTAIAAKTGTTNTLNLEVNFATQALLNLDGFTTVNLSALVDTTITNLEATTSTDVVVSGAKNVTLVGGTTKSVSATALTGILDVTVDTGLTKITGSNQADIFQLADDDFNFTIVGGEGTDTLKNAGGGALDIKGRTVSLTGVDVIDLANVGGLTVASEQITGQTMVLTSTGGAQTLTVDLTNALSADLSNLTVDTTTADVVWTLVNTGLAHSIKGSTGADTMDFSTSTAANTLTGNAGDDVITGGSAADVITAGAGADTINGKGGSDTIDLTEAVQAVDDVIFDAETGLDTITGFVTGDDLSITGVGTNTKASEVVETAAFATRTVDDNDTVIFTFNSATTSALATTGTKTISDFTDVSAGGSVMAYLDEVFSVGSADEAVFVMNNGTDSFIYYYLNDADTDFDAGDTLVLIGQVKNHIVVAADVTQA